MVTSSMRRSLVVRLLALSLLVTVVSIGATAWLATLVVNRDVAQAQQASTAKISTVYRALLQYSATHRNWAGVPSLVRGLSARTGRQIVLMDFGDKPIAVAQVGSARLPLGSPAAVVDPLHVDPALAHNAPVDRIARGALGPYRLDSRDLALLLSKARGLLSCVRRSTGGGRIVYDRLGRPTVVAPPGRGAAGRQCGTQLFAQAPTPDEAPALAELTSATNQCLRAQDMGAVVIGGDLSWHLAATMQPQVAGSRLRPAAARAKATACFDAARREQLAAWVAPPAVLFVTAPAGPQPAFMLSGHNELRVAEVAVAVLALAIGATVLAGRRLVRPLRALTAAARAVETSGFADVVEVRGQDEIAQLGRAFNQMVRVRRDLEEQRKQTIGDIAHELRTPLATIRAWLEAVRDGLADNDEALARSLLEEAVQLQHTVDDLQLLSLADAGRLELHRQEVAVPVLLDQVRSAMSGPASRAGVALEASGPDAVVLVDPVRVRQVLENLVTNAVRHSPPGASVLVAAVMEGATLRVDVVDHGPGIAAADLGRVFDRFWRADISRARADGGSGLGLAIVRQLVELHGGTVGVRSDPGRETVFTIRLPSRRRA